MTCKCNSISDGKAIADLVREKGFESKPPKIDHTITCSCGEIFKMETIICMCPSCKMTYAVTPCSSDKIENIKKCGINY